MLSSTTITREAAAFPCLGVWWGLWSSLNDLHLLTQKPLLLLENWYLSRSNVFSARLKVTSDSSHVMLTLSCFP